MERCSKRKKNTIRSDAEQVVGKVDWDRYYRLAVVKFGVSPSDFFNMRPIEFWWLMGEPVSLVGLTEKRANELQELLNKNGSNS